MALLSEPVCMSRLASVTITVDSRTLWGEESQSLGCGRQGCHLLRWLNWPHLPQALTGPLGFSSTGLYVLVGAGALMMAVGFFGCCGAMRESQCVLGSVSGVYEVGTGWVDQLPWRESGDLV